MKASGTTLQNDGGKDFLEAVSIGSKVLALCVTVGTSIVEQVDIVAKVVALPVFDLCPITSILLSRSASQ